MADSDKNIKITPNRGATNQPIIEFVGQGSNSITLRVLDGATGSIAFEGSEGQLFSISNNLSQGTIFSVNDISGIPFIELDASGTVSLNRFTGNTGIGTGTPSTKLEVSGTISGSNLFTNRITASSIAINNISASTVSVNSLSVIAGASTSIITQNPYVSGFSYSNVALSIGSQDTDPQGIFFRADGAVMYMIGQTNDRIYQYSLSVPWRVTSAALSTTSATVGDSSPRDLFFKDDGTRVYIVCDGVDSVREFILSTPWNISPASMTFSSSFAIAQDSTPQGIWFKPDGTRMYIAGDANNRVYEYTLSTPWSSSTAVYGGISASPSNPPIVSPTAVNFNEDGTRMFLLDAYYDSISEFSLSPAWTLTSSTLIQSYPSLQESTPNGLFINQASTVSKAYVVGSSVDAVYQYDTGLRSIVNEGNFAINGDLNVRNTAYVHSTARFQSDARVFGVLTVEGNTVANGALSAFSTLNLAGTPGGSGNFGTEIRTVNMNIGTNLTSGSIIFGGLTQSSSIFLGRSSASYTVSIASGTVSSQSIQNVFIGTNGLSGSRTNIVLGSSTAGAINTVSIYADTIIPNTYKIGIGVSLPSQRLEVAGAVSASSFISTIVSGTPPFTVSSNTVVTNLNSDLLDGQDGVYYLDYTNITNKPTISDVTININSGAGLTGSGAFTLNQTTTASITISHADTSTVGDVATASGIFISGLTFDTYGHVTGVSTAAGAVAGSTNSSFGFVAVSGQTTVAATTPSDTLTLIAGTNITLSTNNTNKSVTINASSGGTAASAFGIIAIAGQDTVSADDPGDTLTFVAGNGIILTSSATIDFITIGTNGTSSNVNNALILRDSSGNFAATNITANLNGTASNSTALNGQTASFYLNYNNLNNRPAISDVTITIAGNAGLTGSGSFTLNQSTTGSITVSHADTSNVGTLTTSTRTYVSGLTFDTYGHVTALTTATETVSSANNGLLTMAVSGIGLAGSATFSANQSGASTFTVTSNATSSNVNSTIVSRDGSGNFSAGTITANLTGTASNATNLNNQPASYYLDYVNLNNKPIISDSTITIASGSGLTGSGSFTLNQSTTASITVSHADTSNISTLTASANIFVSGLGFDEFGHVLSTTTASIIIFESVGSKVYSYQNFGGAL